MRQGLLSSTSYFALRTPDGVGGGAATVPDNTEAAPAGGAGSRPEAAAPTPPAAAEAPAAPAADAAAAAPAAETPAAKAEPAEHTPSLIEAAKGKEAAADGAVKPAGAAPETPAKAGTESAPAAEPAKSGEPAKDPSADTGAEKPKAGDAAPEVKPPEPLKYEAFKLPGEVKLDEERLKAFTDIVGPNQVKQEAAQQLIDLHTGEIQRTFQAAEKAQRDYWTTQIDKWKTQTRSDSEIGGNRLETSLSIAKAVVEEYGGSKEQQAEFWRHISETQGNGMGNYLGFLRLLHNIGRALNVFEDSIVPAASAPAVRSKEPGQRGWYGPPGERRASAG
jgi:hypothetical protein